MLYSYTIRYLSKPIATSGWVKTIDEIIAGLQIDYRLFNKSMLNWKTGVISDDVKVEFAINNGKQTLTLTAEDCRLKVIRESLKVLEERLCR